MALYLNYVGQVTMVTAVAFIGLILYAFYRGCDPVLAGVVDKRDAVIPLFVMQVGRKVSWTDFCQKKPNTFKNPRDASRNNFVLSSDTEYGDARLLMSI